MARPFLPQDEYEFLESDQWGIPDVANRPSPSSIGHIHPGPTDSRIQVLPGLDPRLSGQHREFTPDRGLVLGGHRAAQPRRRRAT